MDYDGGFILQKDVNCIAFHGNQQIYYMLWIWFLSCLETSIDNKKGRVAPP